MTKLILATVVAGLIISVIWKIIVTYFWKDKPEPEPPAKLTIEEIDIHQKGKELTNVTGADLSPGSNDMELGKVHIEQEADSMRNVTGAKIQGDSNSGTIELKDKMSIEQKTPQGKMSVQFNADNPNVKIKFLDKSNDEK